MDSERAYMKELERKPQATEEQVTEWFKEIKKYRNKIVEGNLKLVSYYAYQFARAWNSIDVMDLIQEGNIGLIKAVDAFIPSKGYKFSTIATAYIQGYMLHYIRDNVGFFKISTKEQREVFDNVYKMRDKFDTDEWTSLMSEVYPSVQNLDGVQEEIIQDSPEDIYIRSEARTNLYKKIRKFEETLTKSERGVWKYRILSQEKTLQELVTCGYGKYPEEIRRKEEAVIKRARDYFSQLDFIDIIS